MHSMGKIFKHNCKGCGNYYEGRGSLFCSVVCSSKDTERRTKQAQAIKGKFQNGENINCKMCKSPFYVSKYYINKKQFCSSACTYKHYSEIFKGKVAWNKGLRGVMKANSGSFIDYGRTEFKNKVRHLVEMSWWRKDVYSRDDYTCQACGVRGGELHADHVVPLAEIINRYEIKTLESARKCVELWDTLNGRTLCIDCHRKTDTWGKGKNYYASAISTYA